MTIEQGEEVFGKRWNSWSMQENREFVSAIELEEITPRAVPGVLTLLMRYLSDAQPVVQHHIHSIIFK